MHIEKIVKKVVPKKEVNEIIGWLTGYVQKQVESQIVHVVTLKDFCSGTAPEPYKGVLYWCYLQDLS